MYSLPTTVVVGNHEYNIRNKGDFRVILDCFSALQDETISEGARILASLIIFYDEFSSIDDLPENSDEVSTLIHQMFTFFNYGKEESLNPDAPVSLIDWDADSQIICAAVNNIANTEIRSLSNLHWWTFLGYYMSIGQSVLATVVSIRDKIVHGKPLEKWEREFRFHNPEYFEWRRTSTEEQEFEKQIREQFHTKGGDK